MVESSWQYTEHLFVKKDVFHIEEKEEYDVRELQDLYSLGAKTCCGSHSSVIDNVKGYVMLCHAAKKGHHLAPYYLATLYEQGVPMVLSDDRQQFFLLPQDLPKAHMWYSIAKTQGHADAEKKLDHLREILSFEQKNDAVRMRSLWKRKQCSQLL